MRVIVRILKRSLVFGLKGSPFRLNGLAALALGKEQHLPEGDNKWSAGLFRHGRRNEPIRLMQHYKRLDFVRYRDEFH
jgi:hypothetical protein